MEQGRAGQMQRALAEIGNLEIAVGAGRLAEGHRRAMPSEAGERASEGVLANRIIGHIGPRPTSDLHHSRRHVFRPVVDDMIKAMRGGERAFLGPTRCADGGGANRFQPLSSQQADPTGGGVEQDGIARLHRIAVIQQIGDGQPLQHDRRRDLGRNAVGKFHHQIGVDGAVRGIGPVRQGIADTVADRDMAHALADGGDDAGPFAAEDQVLVDGPGIGAGADIDIDEIDADGLMLDDHLARGRRDLADLDPVDDLGTALRPCCHCITHDSLLRFRMPRYSAGPDEVRQVPGAFDDAQHMGDMLRLVQRFTSSPISKFGAFP